MVTCCIDYLESEEKKSRAELRMQEHMDSLKKCSFSFKAISREKYNSCFIRKDEPEPQKRRKTHLSGIKVAFRKLPNYNVRTCF